MTNTLVVIIISLKVPKIKKLLLYEMKFLVPNYGCLQNSWLGGYRPQIPVLSVLCPQLNLLNPPPPSKLPGYATAQDNNKIGNWLTRICGKSLPLKKHRLCIMRRTAKRKGRKINVQSGLWLMYTICRDHKTACAEIFDFLIAKLISLHKFRKAVVWPVTCSNGSHFFSLLQACSVTQYCETVAGLAE